MVIDVRTALYAGPFEQQGLRIAREGEVLTVDGIAHGQPFALTVPVRVRTRTARLTTLRIECPGCQRRITHLLVLPTLEVGCWCCRPVSTAASPLRPPARFLRRRPAELTRALDDPARRKYALQALEAGPIYFKTRGVTPSKRITSGFAEPWPDELKELRWRLFGLK